MGWIVKFHADGGQMCVDGVRDFGEDKERAESFAEKMRNEPGHSCERWAQERGSSTVSIDYSDEPVKDDGYVYPALAGLEIGRDNEENYDRLNKDEKGWLRKIGRITSIWQ